MTTPSLARVAEARRLAQSGEARAIREDARISAREMADAVGVHHATLIAWEECRAEPRRDAADRWLTQLDALRSATPPPPGSATEEEDRSPTHSAVGDRPPIP